MRSISKWLVAMTMTAVVVVSGQPSATAGFIGMPRELGQAVRRIAFSNYTLPPMAFTQFCLRYSNQCKPRRIVFRGGPVRLTAERWEQLKRVNSKVNASIIPEPNLEGLAGEKWLIAPDRGGPVRLTAERWEQLKRVNSKVNASIIPEPNLEGLAGEKWLIAPARGDCNDYAVTKRAELLKQGWSTRALLLSEVVTTWGEHHLILVVRTSMGDLLLDNLTGQIRPWSHAPYRWVRIQSPKNPNYWASLVARTA